ncbi:MAG: orotate phosphoribosyltransferase [Myxococcales bacterium]|nr:orotate phosphoribosyltransferase [Myxococcales bacterium]MCB9531842.1 orotate phosphoribosyltransferase [Myxococcales bacterium]
MRARLVQLLREHSYREGDFVLASGRRSRFYVDVRRTSLTAEGAALIGELLLDEIEATGWPVAGAGGMTLGADPLATAVAIASWRRGAPLSAFLVRKAAKGHGAGRRVEAAGTLASGARVVVLDDTVTTGGSTLEAVAALRDEGYEVAGAICVVDRGEGGSEALAAEGIELRALFSLADLAVS